MTDFEIFLVCMLVPLLYALAYTAGKYDVLELFFQSIAADLNESLAKAEEICLLTGNECTNCGLDGCTYRKVVQND